ncbi:DUF4402 domain-containing protein [Novosphingobium sp.]|jgi:hypothetical protein|uniref:DUF4402 domain-containing protein n=1 Tax=Novosphingobium sp. TaxID=1874826 RepID=UPI002607D247|nr:DUF4402 domain-containing protein [Novosphingobium sp.]
MTLRIRPFLTALTVLAAPLPAANPALAAPGGTATMTGTASATVITPISIVATAPLRFGVMARPTAAGTVTVSTAGVVSTSGGMVGNTAIAQGSSGPQAGKFRVTGEPGRQFFVTLPAAATVTRSGGSMTITLFTVGALTGSPVGTLDIAVGGTLAVGAAQTVGTYNGTYQITASYN